MPARTPAARSPEVRTPEVRALAALALAAAALAACAPAATAPRPVGAPATVPPEARLIAAMEAEGCVFSRDTAGAILLRANLTSAEASSIIQDLGARGQVEASGADGAEAIRILSNNCI